MMVACILSSTESHAAGALLALALRQAQIHQTPPPSHQHLEKPESIEEHHEQLGVQTQPWTSQSFGLLRPVFRFLGIDPESWSGIEEIAESPSTSKQHVGEFLRILLEENDERSSESKDQEFALAKAVDAMSRSLEASSFSPTQSNFDVASSETHQLQNSKASSSRVDENCCEKSVLEGTLINNQRKVAVLFELLSACVADTPENGRKHSPLRKGYDARHRVALRLIAIWLDIKWINMEAMEIMVACSAMAAVEEKQTLAEENEIAESEWSKWKRGGIIGAAALTGGTLLAITGGLAAPAIAAGFSALAPTLGTLVPVIGASGFAAVASAAGSVAGSVAVAASFGAAGAGLSGSKMARRIGSIEEFEFKPVGENQNQGRLAVGILVSGFVFEEQDFVRPWEVQDSNLERYALQWESKNLIAVSTAIKDWLTSKVSIELMKRGAMLTVLNTLVAAIAWPTALISATDLIDSTWAIAVDRSDKAGKLLAEVLLKGMQGNRPVTLIGFSLGARVIFKCLQHLAETGDNAEGIIERVVLLGAPISLKDEHWETARKMVVGRFINAYSTNDWMLGIAFRASLLTQGLAGIEPINAPGIENVDVTELIEGHSSYLCTTHKILERLELDNYYPVSTSFNANPQ